MPSPEDQPKPPSDPKLQKPLNEEHMEKAVKEIVFDLGVSPEQARQWAEEEQKRLLDDNLIVTRELVVVKTDAHHLEDDDVPAELVTRKQEAEPWPGEKLVKNIVHAVKEKYQQSKN